MLAPNALFRFCEDWQWKILTTELRITNPASALPNGQKKLWRKCNPIHLEHTWATRPPSQVWRLPQSRSGGLEKCKFFVPNICNFFHFFLFAIFHRRVSWDLCRVFSRCLRDLFPGVTVKCFRDNPNEFRDGFPETDLSDFRRLWERLGLHVPGYQVVDVLDLWVEV